MPKTAIGVTVVGSDHEGVVAAFTNFAFKNGGNIEEVSQNVVKGLFGMYLKVSFGEEIDVEDLDRRIQILAKRERMDASTYHATSSRKNVAVFVTRESHCLEALLGKWNGMKDKICVIVGTEGTLEYIARDAGVPFVTVTSRDQETAEAGLLDACREYSVDLIVLARYMRILTPNFVWRYPNRIINIHPSLLPAFPGAQAYAQAYERGTKIIGVTAHYVTENLDQGPIILQSAFKTDSGDTLEEIREKGQALESKTLLHAVRLHLSNRLEVNWRRVNVKSEKEQ